MLRRFDPGVIRAFMRLVGEIDAAVDERDLRALKSRRFEKLQRGDWSMRINDQFRLTFDKEEIRGEQRLAIKAIEDYH